MERDYFKDRPETVQYNKNLYKGGVVFICLKKMQPKAKEISDLTLTRITANLTSQYQHPRGQKIRGDFIETDKYGNKIFVEVPEEVVGRCTYIMDDNLWSFDTSEGKKFLIYNNKKNKLDMLSYDMLKGYMKIYCVLKNKRASFKIPLCKYVYFKDVEKASEFIDQLSISKCTYQNDMILLSLNGNMIYEDDFEMFLDNNRIINPREMYYYVDSICNGTLPIEAEDFVLEKIL